MQLELGRPQVPAVGIQGTVSPGREQLGTQTSEGLGRDPSRRQGRWGLGKLAVTLGQVEIPEVSGGEVWGQRQSPALEAVGP